MKKTFIFLLFPFLCIGQIPAYYNSIDFDLTGDALKSQLATLITNTHVNDLDYTPEVWTALEMGDLDPDNPENVLLIYGYNDSDNDPDNDRTRDKDDNCHSLSCTGLWVREHVYPRSLGNPNLEYDGPGSDAHHIRAVDYYMNNSRSNRRFAAGSGHSAQIPGGYFYPGDEWKGDVARMMMYMYVRYQQRCLATTVGTGSATYSTNGDMPNIFLEWNEEDPVSTYEMNRNTVLQNMQGNRNPFIDNPYLATAIWNGPQATDTWGIMGTKDIAAQNKVFIYPTITNGTVYIENTENNNYNYTVYNSIGQKIKATVKDNQIELSGNASGIYIINIQNGEFYKTFRVILK